MNYIIITLISLLTAQILKFVFRLVFNHKDNKNFLWVFTYATGAPSAHSTVLFSNLVLLHKDLGNSPVFMFSCLISIIFMYNLIADRKREFIRGSNDLVLDISGHSFFDILTGIVLGLIIGFLYIN